MPSLRFTDPFSPRQPSAQSRSPNRRWPRILLWTVAVLLAVVLLAAGVGLLWLRSAARAALPTLDGSVSLAGLSAPVTVRRDAHGVPHIDAATQDDLFTAQGYVTAQDRLWQMDLYRRNADGTLAAILGPSLLKHDEEQRVLQLRSTAQRIYASMPADERRRWDDYARGVNLYIAHCEQANTLPPEFKLLLYRPTPWTGADSVAVGMTLVETLDTHIETKLDRALVDAKLHYDPQLEADLYPVGSWRDHPPTGQILDLTKPQPPPPPAPDEQTMNGTGLSVTGTGFSPYIEPDNAEKLAVLKGHDFSRAASAIKGARALAPEGRSSGISFQAPSLFARALAPVPISLGAQSVPRYLRGLLGLPTCSDCIAGSNNWVISGAHTASGKPLLSNDMHLD
ncbi:MAG: penicillin acylase family protein, partial [Terracidiphilus sp.]